MVEHWVGLDHHVDGPRLIVLESRKCELPGDNAPADHVLQLQDADIDIRLGQVSGNYEPIMTTADDHHIVCFHCHIFSFHIYETV